MLYLEMEYHYYCILCTVILLGLLHTSNGASVGLGSWEVVVENAGVSSMHMALTHLNTVVMFDRTDYGPSQLKLPNGACRENPNDLALTVDCYAHAIEFSPADNSVRALQVFTDTWCSSGGFTSDGTLVSTGGYNDGSRAVRRFPPCGDKSCDWTDSAGDMYANRWYASNVLLPDNRMLVVGGRRVFSYEFVPTGGSGLIDFPFLKQTYVSNVENNLYPFLHLSSDGNVFVFANTQSILLDYKSNKVLKTFPAMPGGGGRSYPSTGSSVILPLTYSDKFSKIEVMICGGSPDGAYLKANDNGVYQSALSSCGRIVITDNSPTWVMENMPSPRVMGDMIILPTGEVLIINGCKKGAAGWGNCRDPNLSPVIYRPNTNGDGGGNFYGLASTTIPRLYHSTAGLLADGRILVGGSNPNVGYDFEGVLYPTELRLEAYSPYYLDSSYGNLRPTIVSLSKESVGYGSTFDVEFSVSEVGVPVEFRVSSSPFITHSYAMSQRQLVLEASPITQSGGQFTSTITAPPSAIAAPPGYYLLFVVNGGIPSVAKWVRFT